MAARGRNSSGLGRPGLVAIALSTALGCGSRSGLNEGNAGAPLGDGGVITACLGDLDCEKSTLCAPVRCVAGACVAAPKVSCDDGDPCTSDRCVPGTGACEFRQRTRDEDGDGHRGPLPGTIAGTKEACGDDCDDTSALAFPGATEVCDGVDNDCNGIVDDGALYVPSSEPPVLLSSGAKQAEIGGVAASGSTFASTFAAQDASFANTFTTFDGNGTILVPATPVTHENTDSFSGPILWTGSVFATAWEDRRDQDYEIYFNRLDPSGNKLSSDLRVTDAGGFSILPDLVWDGSEFVVAWSDKREGDGNGFVFAQRIDADGKLVGKNVSLTPNGADADAPRLAKGATELGLVFNERADSGRQLAFRTVSVDLATLGTVVVVPDGDAASSAVAWSGDRYVVVWDTLGAEPGPAIRGAAFSRSGEILVPPRDVTMPARFARSEALLPLGDRLLLVWGNYDDGTGAYALFSTMLDQNLDELGPETRVVAGPSDSIDPVMAFSSSSGVAIAFEDRRTGSFQAYATWLVCGGNAPPSRKPLL